MGAGGPQQFGALMHYLLLKRGESDADEGTFTVPVGIFTSLEKATETAEYAFQLETGHDIRVWFALFLKVPDAQAHYIKMLTRWNNKGPLVLRPDVRIGQNGWVLWESEILEGHLDPFDVPLFQVQGFEVDRPAVWVVDRDVEVGLV